MSIVVKAACVQNNAKPEPERNIAEAGRLTREAAAQGARLIALPEYFSGLRSEGPRIHPVAFPEARHPVLAAFTDIARETRAWLLLGSLGVSAEDGRTLNRSYVLDPEGRVTARYDKIHMFDVDLGEGHSYRESATIAPGGQAVVAETPWGGLGLSICYDLRFGALYRSLAQAGAVMLAVPAAFTRMTGRAHWHVLNRARAIENGAFVLAPCQYGDLEGGGQCYGHSLIVAPWGEVLADAGEDEGLAIAELDMAAVEAARRKIPSLGHDRAFAPPPVEAPAAAAE